MFYKLLDDNTISYGPFVHSPEYMLNYQLKDTYQYPVDGWYWFNTVEEAEAHYGVQIN